MHVLGLAPQLLAMCRSIIQTRHQAPIELPLRSEKVASVSMTVLYIETRLGEKLETRSCLGIVIEHVSVKRSRHVFV